jgi:hypothetical protein
MKKIIITIGLVLSLVSCASVQRTNIDTIGSIAQPNIIFTVELSLDKSNLVILGPIDEMIEVDLDFMPTSSGSFKQSEIKVKQVYISNLISRDDGIAQLRNLNPALFDTALSDLAGRCLAKYPELDYIMFPKIQLELVTNGSRFNMNPTYYKMRLTGNAVKLKL